MSTSKSPILSSPSPATSRGPLRLRMTEHPGRDQLDGGWWPWSRDLAMELTDLVDQFPRGSGRIIRVLFAPPDWEPAPRRVRVAGGYVKVGPLPSGETHLVHLETSDHAVLRVLVVPPAFTAQQGDESLLAAATRGNAHSAFDLLATASEHPDVEPEEQWNDLGRSWWGPHRVAPSFRAAADQAQEPTGTGR